MRGWSPSCAPLRASCESISLWPNHRAATLLFTRRRNVSSFVRDIFSAARRIITSPRQPASFASCLQTLSALAGLLIDLDTSARAILLGQKAIDFCVEEVV